MGNLGNNNRACRIRALPNDRLLLHLAAAILMNIDEE
jgi:hypothetical protein